MLSRKITHRRKPRQQTPLPPSARPPRRITPTRLASRSSFAARRAALLRISAMRT